MKTDLFDYPLPERLIAQKPADRRDQSRLLVVHRAEHRIEHRHFRDLPEYLQAGDCLFRNNAAFIPARLHAMRPTGGQVEFQISVPAADFSATPTLLQIQRGGQQGQGEQAEDGREEPEGGAGGGRRGEA